MKSTILRASLLAAGALVLAGPANADVLFDQAYDGSGFAASSQNDTGGGNGNFATVYDDFSVAADSNITGLTFTGIFFNPPEVGDITGFTVNVYDDAANQPGSVLSSTFFGGNGGQACADVTCTYSLGLTFSASAATTYWLSIVPDLSFPPQWGWAESFDGNAIYLIKTFSESAHLCSMMRRSPSPDRRLAGAFLSRLPGRS